MEYEKIKQLMDDMGNSKLSSINIEFPDGTKINMEKSNEGQKVILKSENNQEKLNKELENNIEENNNKEQKENIKTITSPMVGTFYSRPSPKAETYVEVGKEVKKGDTLCIIEAMKLMNEIESEITGKVLSVLVEDGTSVEYGTPLFEIEI